MCVLSQQADTVLLDTISMMVEVVSDRVVRLEQGVETSFKALRQLEPWVFDKTANNRMYAIKESK
jgi:hypothetical protein